MKNQKQGKPSSFNDRSTVIGVDCGKLPPQAVDMEEAVLGALMLERDAVDDVIGILTPDCFYRESHAAIYRAIVDINMRREPVDLLTVTQELRRRGILEETGGTLYIAQLTTRVMSAVHAEYHARIVFQKYIQRELIRVCSETLNRAFADETDIDDLYRETEMQHAAIGELIAGKNRSREFSEILNDCIEEQYRRKENYEKGIANGIRTGFCDLDRLTNGWQNSDMIILAARPSMGKTAVALKMLRAAAESGVPGVFFSLEMKDRQLVHRMIMSQIGTDPANYSAGRMTAEEMAAMEEGIGRICGLPVHIDDNAGVTVSYIRSQARMLKKQGKCGIIFIDYLQLIRELENANRNREQAMSAISNQCKSMAMELDVPVIALSQLNRQLENRANKEPTLADLRDSGSLEQDADVVVFVHRPEKFGFDVTDETGNIVENAGKLIVAKQRNGRTGEVKFTHNGSLTEFYDWNIYGHSRTDVF